MTMGWLSVRNSARGRKTFAGRARCRGALIIARVKAEEDPVPLPVRYAAGP